MEKRKKRKAFVHLSNIMHDPPAVSFAIINYINIKFGGAETKLILRIFHWFASIYTCPVCCTSKGFCAARKAERGEGGTFYKMNKFRWHQWVHFIAHHSILWQRLKILQQQLSFNYLGVDRLRSLLSCTTYIVIDFVCAVWIFMVEYSIVDGLRIECPIWALLGSSYAAELQREYTSRVFVYRACYVRETHGEAPLCIVDVP